MKLDGLEVFQELVIKVSIDLSSAREKILSKVSAPWSNMIEEEREIRGAAIDDEDVIVFSREPFDNVDESSLILWQDGNSYRVANIVPKNVGDLGIKKYNLILRDFYEKVIYPLVKEEGFNVTISSKTQSLDDWLDESTANSLSLFLRMANKYTGASHPLDEQRWYEFLINAHKSSASLDAEQLSRWLIEVDSWPDEIARELAINYEFARGLLKTYDEK
ncbi:hypothetical protein [Serratia plymuthica]|uniref:Uncharacterized protein n=1 Tax=Serratia plymuthica TaxID=82996 RepID=A0A2X4UYV5_SERPL|nr:hypothetical protein [Serratia plymuthica]QPS19807.1 hypothetical protein I6G64_19845 [Serratia plymuthica]QPS61519.1 hypothetical protein I6G52_15640 [Serratia plymuthica]RKS61405.1 hypothetical protein C8E17_0532 [Serratia plymuthica]CAI2467647.1 Uncharacterised protein [Serratia plymuthica]SQI44011.1 Uncharacterised protein [Serratia plymuthica]